jgi:hypothetical protein
MDIQRRNETKKSDEGKTRHGEQGWRRRGDDGGCKRVHAGSGDICLIRHCWHAIQREGSIMRNKEMPGPRNSSLMHEVRDAMAVTVEKHYASQYQCHGCDGDPLVTRQSQKLGTDSKEKHRDEPKTPFPTPTREPHG